MCRPAYTDTSNQSNQGWMDRSTVPVALRPSRIAAVLFCMHCVWTPQSSLHVSCLTKSIPVNHIHTYIHIYAHTNIHMCMHTYPSWQRSGRPQPRTRATPRTLRMWCCCGSESRKIAFVIVKYERKVHIPDSSVDPDQHALAVHVLGHSSKAVGELGAVDL